MISHRTLRLYIMLLTHVYQEGPWHGLEIIDSVRSEVLATIELQLEPL